MYRRMNIEIIKRKLSANWTISTILINNKPISVTQTPSVRTTANEEVR